jgi:hypothetical protein
MNRGLLGILAGCIIGFAIYLYSTNFLITTTSAEDGLKDITKSFIERSAMYYENEFEGTKAIEPFLADSIEVFFLVENITKDSALKHFNKQKNLFPQSFISYNIDSVKIQEKAYGFNVVLPIQYYLDKTNKPKEYFYQLKFNNARKLFFARAFNNNKEQLKRLLK